MSDDLMARLEHYYGEDGREIYKSLSHGARLALYARNCIKEQTARIEVLDAALGLATAKCVETSNRIEALEAAGKRLADAIVGGYLANASIALANALIAWRAAEKGDRDE